MLRPHVPMRRSVAAASVLLLGAVSVQRAQGQTPAASDDAIAPTRPAILFNRWQEDWSVLANPQVPRQPFDALKYISLSSDDPHKYLSLGAGIRERFESNDAAGFGTGRNRSDDYLISRSEVHADLHWGTQVQGFAQLQSDYAFGKSRRTPVDQDHLGLEQGFVAISEQAADGVFKFRVGRQQLAFDLQRFVSVRDGTNVRQSYDAAWLDYERGAWRLTSFFSHPVVNRDAQSFDDYSSGHLTFGGVKLERRLTGAGLVSVYYAHFTQDNVRMASASGNESRDIIDFHYSGVVEETDWDVESMGQTGNLGAKSVRAWAFGSLAGHTLVAWMWSPRFGLQIDAASGDHDPNGRTLGTFNPLFPNGYYVTLAAYSGYVNFIHVKPSVTLHPAANLKLVFAAAAQWRETTADAVYTVPNIPVAGTAGEGSAYSGAYGQVRLDWTISRAAAFAIEATHFAVGEAIRHAGGHDSNYAGVEIKYGW